MLTMFFFILCFYHNPLVFVCNIYWLYTNPENKSFFNHMLIIIHVFYLFFSTVYPVFLEVLTVKILCIGTDRSQQTVETKIRLLLKKQSDQDLRCLPFHQHLLEALMQCYIKLFYF